MTEHEGGSPLGFDATTLLMAGGFVLGFALIVVLLTIAFTPFLAYICVPGGIVPGAIAVGLGLIEYRREKRLEEFATFLEAYRRISMADLAKKLGMDRLEAERVLAKAIELHYVDGVVDRSTDEFVLKGAEAQQVFIGKCPQCGGEVSKWAFPEERVFCPYCNFAIAVQAPKPASASAST